MARVAVRKTVAGARVFIALAFAATILLEPAVDRTCHSSAPQKPSQVSSNLASPTGSTEDPCGKTCLPDCYCCSTPLAVAVVFALPPVPLMSVSQAIAPRPLEGFTAVPHLPPIA